MEPKTIFGHLLSKVFFKVRSQEFKKSSVVIRISVGMRRSLRPLGAASLMYLKKGNIEPLVVGGLTNYRQNEIVEEKCRAYHT